MGSRLTDIEARITRLEGRMGPREGETIQEWANGKEAEFMRFLRVDLLNPTDESMRLGEQAFAESIAARAISVIEEIDQNAVHRGWYSILPVPAATRTTLSPEQPTHPSRPYQHEAQEEGRPRCPFTPTITGEA